ncbi:MAG: outer membrane protein assembly factor BamB family protein [Planctomycetota bacterium]|jgi:outer membrane protein assembly factor BamB
MPSLRTFISPTVPAVLLAAFWSGAHLRAAEAPYWPQFHGPKRDNISTETGLLKKWPSGGPKLLWTARGIGHGFASVSIAKGLAYTTGNIDNRTVITCLDLDGGIRWQVDNGPAWTKDKPGSRATPTIDTGRLYHKSPYGHLICLDAKTGKRIWGLNILEKFQGKNITWALAESLLVDGDHLICSPGGPETAVVALDKNTGKTVWKSPTAEGDRAGYSSPALAEYKGLRMILKMTSRAMIGVNADSGDLLWRFPHKSPWDENIFMPIFHDGQVFITSRTTGSVMLRVHVQGKKASVEEVWRSRELDNHHGGVVLLDGYLYGSCVAPRWVCLDWKTGRTMYTARGVGKGSLTCADGLLYTLGENSTMGLVKPTAAAHDLISEFRIPAGGKGLSWAHPVVCGGRLYIRHSDYLYAYDVRAR